MRLLSPRVMVVLAAVVIAWGGVHLLSAHTSSVTPALWPVAQPSSTPRPAVALPVASVPSTSPPAGGGVPILPGALHQLNGSTRDTAIGLYAVIEQLEAAMRGHLEQLAQQLEPGR